MPVFINNLLEREGLIELNVGVAAVNHNDQKLLQPAGNGPGVRQQQLYQGFLLVRGAAPEQGNRNDLDILIRVFEAVVNQSLELAGRRRRLAPPEKTTNPVIQKEERMRRSVFNRQSFRRSG